MADALVAVLTGDVVRSSALSSGQRQRLLATLSGLPEALAEPFPAGAKYQVDVFRGDSWQLLVPEPRLAPRIAIFLRAQLRASFEAPRLDTRIGIGVGGVDATQGEDLGRADGPAFRLSGRALEALEHETGMGLALPAGVDPLLAEGLNVILDQVNVHLGRWTPKQAHAVAGALTGHTQVEIAADWPADPISQQAVAQHLDRAEWHSIERALDFIERALELSLPDEARGTR